ncbi:MAG: rhodanese-like domain-containing protein [Chloroflexi bacterium]|nr:rhodanese-like domain-containing protein [Chloroflexota bacterium]
MIQTITSLEDLQALVQRGGLLVDVLLAEQYALEHIPGAINLPLKALSRSAVSSLPRDRPIVVYCDDFQ